MPKHTGPGPLVLDRPDDITRLRDVLDGLGYDFEHVRARIGTKQSADLGLSECDRPRLLRCTRSGDPLDTLIRVFLTGVPVPLEAFRRAVAPMSPEEWADLGLVEIEADRVWRLCVLKPIGPHMLVHDGPPIEGRPERDLVMGVTGSSLTLASVTVRPPMRSMLDLGTGSGYLALLAAAHSQRVTATDVNPRAVAAARFNAILNRKTNIETAQGSLFEPVGDRRFDLITSNPPFVVSPERELDYRDSGLERDAICERILRTAPNHLTEGGFAQVLCNWVRIRGQDWLARLSQWFEGSECDVWIIHRSSVEPGEYAQNWLSQGGFSPPDRFADDWERWIRYYDENEIEAIDVGLINLRRRAGGRNWLRVDRERDLDQCQGAGLLVGFATHDLLDSLNDDSALLDFKLLCRPELRLSQRLKPSESGWTVDGAECRLGQGLQFEGDMNPMVFHLLTLCRGQLSLSAVLSHVASRLGQDEEAIRNECLGAARSLVLQGFLWPAEVPLEPAAFDGPRAPAGGGSPDGCS
jgi:SAM-dependent methyltransferase